MTTLLRMDSDKIIMGTDFDSRFQFIRKVASAQDAFYSTGATIAFDIAPQEVVRWRYRNGPYTATYGGGLFGAAPAVSDTSFRVRF